jgi:hypothetical protein
VRRDLVRLEVAGVGRAVAAAGSVAEKGALASVGEQVPLEEAVLPRAVAAAWHSAGVGTLASVSAHVHGEGVCAHGAVPAARRAALVDTACVRPPPMHITSIVRGKSAARRSAHCRKARHAKRWSTQSGLCSVQCAVEK